MTAQSIRMAMTEIAVVYTSVYGADNLEVPNRAFDVGSRTEWAKLTLTHTSGSQDSLAGADGKRRWNATGLGTLSLMFPLGEGIEGPLDIAEAVQALYQGNRTSSDVWFRNVRIEERDPRGDSPPPKSQSKFYQIDVVFEFTYDTLK